MSALMGLPSWAAAAAVAGPSADARLAPVPSKPASRAIAKILGMCCSWGRHPGPQFVRNCRAGSEGGTGEQTIRMDSALGGPRGLPVILAGPLWKRGIDE